MDDRVIKAGNQMQKFLDMPPVKVTKKKEENLKLEKIIEALQPLKVKKVKKRGGKVDRDDSSIERASLHSEFQKTQHEGTQGDKDDRITIVDNNSRPMDRQGSVVLSDDGFEAFEDDGPELKEEEARKTVEEIEKEKEQEEIHNSLRGIKTLREINEAFAAVVDP